MFQFFVVFSVQILSNMTLYIKHIAKNPIQHNVPDSRDREYIPYFNRTTIVAAYSDSPWLVSRNGTIPCPVWQRQH